MSLETTNKVRVYAGQPGTGEATLFTCPGSNPITQNDVLALKEIVLTNTTGSAATISLSLVPVGGTAGATNRILAGYSVAANGTVVLTINEPMIEGETLSGLQGTANAVTMRVAGLYV